MVNVTSICIGAYCIGSPARKIADFIIGPDIINLSCDFSTSGGVGIEVIAILSDDIDLKRGRMEKPTTVAV